MKSKKILKVTFMVSVILIACILTTAVIGAAVLYFSADARYYLVARSLEKDYYKNVAESPFFEDKDWVNGKTSREIIEKYGEFDYYDGKNAFYLLSPYIGNDPVNVYVLYFKEDIAGQIGDERCIANAFMTFGEFDMESSSYSKWPPEFYAWAQGKEYRAVLKKAGEPKYVIGEKTVVYESDGAWITLTFDEDYPNLGSKVLFATYLGSTETFNGGKIPEEWIAAE